MNLWHRRCIFGFLGVLAVSLTASSAADARMVGSDLLGRELTVAVQQFVARSGLAITVAFDGSRPGMNQLKSGHAQIGLLILPDGELPDEAMFVGRTIAWHRAVVLVSAKNPLERVTMGELGAVFGTGVGAGYNRWGDLGLTGDWSGSPITALAPASGVGITSEFFRYAVLGGQPLKTQILRYAATEELEQRVAADRRVMALAANRPKNLFEAKILSLAAGPSDPAFPPTPENIVSGDYPLRLGVRIVYRRDAESALTNLLVWLWSDEVAEIFGRADLVAEPASGRRRQVQLFEKSR